MLETGLKGFLQINTKYCYLPEHKLTVLYLWQKITHTSLTNSSVIPVLVITFSASGKGRHCTSVKLPQLLPSKMLLVAVLKSNWAWGEAEPGARPVPPAQARLEQEFVSWNPSLAAATPSCRDSADCRGLRSWRLQIPSTWNALLI